MILNLFNNFYKIFLGIFSINKISLFLQYEQLLNLIFYFKVNNFF